MNFDEMDIEPKSEPPVVRKTPPQSSDSFSKIEKVNDDELQSQLLLRTVSLDDGNIGYVFTCTKNGPLATWRCHVCNFVDTWKNLIKHLETKWHHDSISKYRHSRSNFSKVENAIPDISKGQPLPPGMEEEIAGPCQILKSLQTYDHPLIGLEFLLEMHIVDLKEPRYLCLLCDKRGDPRSILVHLTSQNHYLMYLRKYFRKFYALIDKLPKSNECRGNVSTVTSHLIGKLEEKYGRLQPTATREDVINVPEQRSIILQKIDNSVHFSESAEDSYLEDMLTIEYVQSPHLLLKNFPLKPKQINTEKPREDSKSLFNKSSRNASKKHIRSRDSDSFGRDNSPDILYVGSAKNSHSRNDRSRERSPLGHSRPRSRSHHRSRTPDRGRRRYVSPTFYRSSRYRLSRSRSPRRNRSRSPLLDRDRFYRRSMTPLSITSRGRERSPFPPSRYSYRYRSPERDSRRIHHRSPSPVRNDDHLRYRGRSRSRELRSRDRSPFYRPRRSRSRSRPRHNSEIRSNSRSSMVISDPPKVREKERTEVNTSRAYIREAKEMEERLNKDMDRFTETPESHPAYQDEWKKFWCAKFKEIQSKGKEDPHKYDYKPEWIIFWNKRVKELFDSEMKTRIKALKTKYGISGEEKLVKEPREEKKEEKKVKSICSDDDEKRPVIDIKTMWKELTGCEIKDEPAKRKSPSPWEEDNDDTNSDKEGSTKGASKKRSNNVLDEGCTTPISPEPLSSISDAESPRRSPMRRSRSPSRSRSRSRSAPRSFSKEYPFKDEYRKPATKKIHFENPLNIITVLRQLSVLEFQLGSYASHVVTLLTSGLTMERIKPQSSVELLTKENILFLELVKEKLKGQLLAGVVPKSMVKATLFCIKNIEELLLLVPKLKPSVPPPIPAPPPALLYGAGVDSIGGHVPSASGSHQFGHHVYGHYPHPTAGGYKPMPPAFKHYDRSGGIGDKYKERFPFRKSSPKRHDDGGRGPAIDKVRRPSDEFPFRNNEPVTAEPLKDKPVAAAPVEEEVTIDKNLIALQIAEVLTQQGRSDVSNEELQALINTVVENLKQEQRMKALQKDSAPLKELNIPAAVNAVTAPGANVAANSTFNVPTIPAGFNLNDVSSTTLALLQDAYVNASVLSAAKPFAIDDLTEAELIQMLRNFKNIPRVKQEKLIEFLRKLEVTNPDRVEELKKYVNVL